MSTVQHTLRLPRALDQALRKHAAARELTPYAFLQLCVRSGLASAIEERGQTPRLNEIARELGALSARLAHVERLTERTLYVACAAYVYARAAAPARVDDTQLSDDITAAFQRQLSHAGDAS
ncbi:hypothetical protein [Gluconobacter sphaericus]|uniref:hypothetical protein n=1 Tax=Gluconobacter sphaericus TaxID=574987 RepID=UPI002010D114|nr:hypothetical protein [Gluconobacter sphaericus]